MMPREIYHPEYAGPFIAAFVIASLVAGVALVLHLVRERPLRRTAACAALVLVAIAIALSCAAVLYVRAHMDAELMADSLLTPCHYERLRHGAYGEARASAALALWAAPFALVVATYVAARSLKRLTWLGWAAAPWALFAAAGCLYLQPLPGRFLQTGQCELYDHRAAILGADRDRVRRGCVELAKLLENPSAMAQSLGAESQEAVLPDLRQLKKRCLADLLGRLPQGPYVSRRDTLGSPFVAPEDVAEVQRTLDDIGAP
jgi:lysylphosphatidylglycerol synthetase-like protein (DUF2156 family)